MEHIDANLWYRWFVGLGIDDKAWHPTTTKRQERQGLFSRIKEENDTHQSTTDPESRLYKKGKGVRIMIQPNMSPT